MRLLVFLTLILSMSVEAKNCMTESETLFKIVASKWAIKEAAEENPDKFAEEMWLYVWGASSKAFEEKNISKKKALDMAKLVAENDFSKNPEVEVNIFEDYWYLSCQYSETGVSTNPLHLIPKKQLVNCWESATSRESFQNCLAPLVKSS